MSVCTSSVLPLAGGKQQQRLALLGPPAVRLQARWQRQAATLGSCSSGAANSSAPLRGEGHVVR